MSGSLLGLDSTLLKRGTLAPFTVPLGVGIVPHDAARLEDKLRDATRRLAGKFPELAKRPWWCSTHLLRKCPPVRAIDLLEPIVKALLSEVKVAWVIWTVTGLQSVKIRGLTEEKEVPREKFMSNLQQDYVLHSLWKMRRLEPGNNTYHCLLDGANPVASGAFLDGKLDTFEILYHGDEVSSLVCTADIVARYIDVKLESMPDPTRRYRSAQLNTENLEGIFKGSGIVLRPAIIGTKDFHYTTPLRAGGGGVTLPVRHPIIYFMREPPPKEAGTFPSSAVDTLEAFSPMGDFVVNRAIEKHGCWKRWDNSDLSRIDEQTDEVVYQGPIGEKLADWIKLQRPGLSTVRFGSSVPSSSPGG